LSSFASAVFIAILTLILGYFLGVRQTKKQALSKYITDTAGELYPSLFYEIKENLAMLDTYLEKPNRNFRFPNFEDIYNRGLERFIEKHHKELFLILDNFKNNILPKFHEIDALFMDIWTSTFPEWSEYLRTSLPKEVRSESKNISHDLSKSDSLNYVLPDLLNQRDDMARSKINCSITENTTHIYAGLDNDVLTIKSRLNNPDFEKIAQVLIEMTKPKTTNFIEKYEKLKILSEEEIRAKILPMIQRYISCPI